ncbi:Zinc finger BED domain-containing protein DAYSLEEPER, partial [Bienertia sinuspersici]
MDNMKNTIDFSDDDELEEVYPPTSKPFQCEDGTYKRQRKLTSDVWAEFEFLEPNTDGVLRCKCKRCGQSYNARSNIGTCNLRRHLDRCKKRKFRDVGQMILDCRSEGVMAIASILDPHYRFQILEWGYEKIYGRDYEVKFSSLKDKLNSLFNEYMADSSSRKACNESVDIGNSIPVQESDALMNPQLEELCGSLMKLKVEDQVESPPMVVEKTLTF